MVYPGGKARIAKEILPVILADRKEGQYFAEPFLGATRGKS
nr:MAG TPA: DNA adenine methylase [Caudoviricetes sp.]